jgi:prolyl-tRNA editing enzyme YbaK/EbsC (Cys-tRNA(Pro) deacylase)
MKDFIHALRSTELQIPKKRFNFQLAPEEASNSLTGFIHNAVCPFGMKAHIPIIICKSCFDVETPIIWLGAGNVDAKLGIPLCDFVRATGALVADISDPRILGPTEMSD